jgi:hypothetical protein
MKNCLRFAFFAFIFIALQSFLNKTKRNARKTFQEYIDKYNYKATIVETDTTIAFSLRDPKVKPLDETLYFKHGICYKDANFFNCDSCMKKMLEPIIANQTWQWVMVSNTKYISKRKFVLEITSNETFFSYVLKKEKIKKKDYNKIISMK